MAYFLDRWPLLNLSSFIFLTCAEMSFPGFRAVLPAAWHPHLQAEPLLFGVTQQQAQVISQSKLSLYVSVFKVQQKGVSFFFLLAFPFLKNNIWLSVSRTENTWQHPDQCYLFLFPVLSRKHVTILYNKILKNIKKKMLFVGCGNMAIK